MRATESIFRTVSLALLLLPLTLAAQEPPVPAGWTFRADEGGHGGLRMEAMPPGWHLHPGAAGILYRPADQASGEYRLSATLHLFPGGGSRREAFGLFIGGQNLAGPAQRYTYFLIRGDGRFKIKRRAGKATSDVTGWVASPAITQAKPDGPVANVVEILVSRGRVSFQVNGREVYTAPAAGLDTEGLAGLRINHNLSVHLEALALHPM